MCVYLFLLKIVLKVDTLICFKLLIHKYVNSLKVNVNRNPLISKDWVPIYIIPNMFINI